jgi:predicted glycoside hydrolase/deacetylase ChbG (UPF0249 family)
MRKAGHRVVLCADDFGMTQGVSRGIADLIDMGRLSATSAMTNMPWWPRLGPDLRRFEGQAGLGLHLNLTLGAPLAAMPRLAPGNILPTLSSIGPRALSGSLPLDEIRDEIDRQLVRFVDIIGRPPDYVDGHQHVHVLPGVRRMLLFTLRRRGLEGRVWLRDPGDGLSAILRRGHATTKALAVRSLAMGFRRAARRAGFETNRGFSGFSDFDATAPVERGFHRFFQALGPRHLVMCHPGYVDDELRRLDPVVDARLAELRYLASDGFLDLLEVTGTTLTPSPAD